MAWNDDGWGGSARTQIILHQSPQRRPMQMIEVGMRHQHQINGWQVPHSKSGTPQALEHEKPAREVRVNHHALPAQLHKETGMPDESHSQLTVRYQTRLVGLTAQGSYRGMAHQSPKLRRAPAECRIAERCLDHLSRPP